MGWPRITIDAAMFAAAVGIDAGIESDVRAVVVGNDAGAVIAEKLGARTLRTIVVLLVGITVLVRFEVDFFEPIGRVFQRATAGPGRFGSGRMRRIELLDLHGTILAHGASH